MLSLRSPRFAFRIALLAVLACAPAAAIAQPANSRPVVQPLPPSEVTDLKDALRVLQRKPRDLEALLNAGYASLGVNDLEAARGFFARAEAAAPADPRVKQGQASVFLRAGNPVAALELFDRAEAAGAPPREVLSDRGLAYDLVGDQLRAQAHYREALRERPNDAETVRRMAVSQAIAGNQLAFEETLRPLIDQQDLAAFRARAFGMAILGEQERAAAVTRELIPKPLADKIVPFLEYMPRLTKAQQAAAANLGIFPLPRDIGRENPVIASYASESAAAATASGAFARNADSRLEPVGEPLGRRGPAPVPALAPAPVPAPVAVPIADPIAAPIAAPAPARAVVPVPAQGTVVVVTSPGTPDPAAPSTAPAPTRPAQPAAAAPGFDLANAALTPAPNAPTKPASKPASNPAPKPGFSFDDAFADIGPARADKVVVSGNAVNIAAIEVPREAAPQPAVPKPAAPKPATAKPATAKPATAKPATAKPAAAKSAPPQAPRRYWVQLGTGQEAAPLKYDWRRLARQVPDLLGKLSPYTVPVNGQHRLLAGPFETEAKRDELLRALSAKGLGVLPYTSPEGTQIQKLE